MRFFEYALLLNSILYIIVFVLGCSNLNLFCHVLGWKHHRRFSEFGEILDNCWKPAGQACKESRCAEGPTSAWSRQPEGGRDLLHPVRGEHEGVLSRRDNQVLGQRVYSLALEGVCNALQKARGIYREGRRNCGQKARCTPLWVKEHLRRGPLQHLRVASPGPCSREFVSALCKAPEVQGKQRPSK